MAELDYVADFVRDIRRSSRPDLGDVDGLLSYRKGKGVLALSRKEASAYGDVVSRLDKRYRTKEDVSLATLKTYVQDVLFGALFGTEGPGDESAFEARLSGELTSFRAKLREPAVTHTCYLPVSSLSEEGLPWTLGTVRLLQMNAARLRRLVLPPGADLSSRQVAKGRELIKELTSDESLTRPMAEVTVLAKDSGAAMDLAMRRTREIVDVLNFFALLIPNTPEWVHLAGEAERTVSSALVVRDGRLAYMSSALKGPPGHFSCKRLKSTSSLRPALRRVHELLRNRGQSQVGELVMTSIVWAGRASVEPIREQAFLQYVIALETLMLPVSTQAIKNRLQTRVAHFLGATAGERQRLYDTMRGLYTTRSDIVHDGSFDVSADDLDWLRSIVAACILRALVRRKIRQLTTPGELARWLDTH